MRREVKDGRNIMIGWIIEGSTVWYGHHRRKGLVGEYYPRTDQTMVRGWIYCKGNGLDSLIRTAEAEWQAENKR